MLPYVEPFGSYLKHTAEIRDTSIRGSQYIEADSGAIRRLFLENRGYFAAVRTFAAASAFFGVPEDSDFAEGRSATGTFLQM